MERWIGFFAILMLPAVLPSAGAPAPAAKPNFVLFYTDDQPYLGMGFTGNPVIQTPHMNRLAEEGVFFDKAFVTTAICCSSRASLYTGQHMRRHGIRDFRTPLSATQWQQTFPALLRKAGYRTAFLGKFAIGAPGAGRELALPADQFDLWYGFPQSISFKQKENGKDRYLTTVMTEKVIDFLKSTKPDQPFCIIMALKEPHGPLSYSDPEFPDPYTKAEIPRPKNLTRESFDALPKIVQNSLGANPRWINDNEAFQHHMRQIYAYVSRSDLAVGQVREALAKLGLDGNTVVIHTSDHGSMGGAHGMAGKWLMYEESIQVPLTILDPRQPAETRGRRTQMVLNVDLAPTILAMAGVAVPDGMQGIDLRPVLRDPEAPGRKDWYYEHVYHTKPPRRPIPRCEGVRTERWKYVRYPDAKPLVEELFDLKTDPHEEKNLSRDPEHADTLVRLRARSDAYRKALK